MAIRYTSKRIPKYKTVIIIMPNRVVRESILESDKVNTLQWGAEVFYRRLMSIVDDFGRYEHNIRLIRPKLYPQLLEKVSMTDTEKWMRECVEAGLISLYEIGNKKYLEIKEFNQTVRIKKSKYPPPPDDHLQADASRCKHMQAYASETKGNETNQETKAKPHARYLVAGESIEDLRTFFETKFPRAYQEFEMHFGKSNFRLWLTGFCTLNVGKRWRDEQDLRDHIRNWCLNKQQNGGVVGAPTEKVIIKTGLHNK